jgi:hypothetical protein
MNPTEAASRGTATATSQERPTSSCRAMMIPPIIMIGAVTIMVRAMAVTVWICWTSLVFRVMREGAPKPATSRLEKSATRVNTADLSSRPSPMAVRDPK